VHLVAEPTPFVTFTRADKANPGAFLWHEYRTLDPIAPRFTGKVVVLVDETSVSSAEYHALAFRAAPEAVVMGSTTAGADGNVSRFALPGGLSTAISGIVEVRPTIAGIRAGRDEVLEAAVAVIIGRAVREDEAGSW
jgi:hypothetical protein